MEKCHSICDSNGVVSHWPLKSPPQSDSLLYWHDNSIRKRSAQAGGSEEATESLLSYTFRRSRSWIQSSVNRGVENVCDAFRSFCRAFDIGSSIASYLEALPLIVCNRHPAQLSELPNHIRIVPLVQLIADDDDRCARAKVSHFGNPFFDDVLECVRLRNREADDKDVGSWIREGSETIVAILTRCVVQVQVYRSSFVQKHLRVVVEDSWNVHAGEWLAGEAEQDARFANGSKTIFHQLWIILSVGEAHPSPTTTHLMVCITTVFEPSNVCDLKCSTETSDQH